MSTGTRVPLNTTAPETISGSELTTSFKFIGASFEVAIILPQPPRIEDAPGIELGLQPRRQRGERRRLRLEHRDRCAYGRRGAHQRRVAAAMRGDQTAHGLGFGIPVELQPGQPALP